MMPIRVSRLRSQLRYLVVGCAANAMGLLFFYVFVQTGIPPELAAILAFFAALITGYALNRCWTFHSTVRHTKGIPAYVFSMAAVLLLQIALLSLLHRLIGIPPFVAQIIAVGISIPVSYLLQKKWVFVG
jgi:putative flippase GtrA